MERARLLNYLADRISRVDRPHPLRVAIDGPDAAGKTTLAEELVSCVSFKGCLVACAAGDAAS